MNRFPTAPVPSDAAGDVHPGIKQDVTLVTLAYFQSLARRLVRRHRGAGLGDRETREAVMNEILDRPNLDNLDAYGLGSQRYGIERFRETGVANVQRAIEEALAEPVDDPLEETHRRLPAWTRGTSATMLDGSTWFLPKPDLVEDGTDVIVAVARARALRSGPPGPDLFTVLSQIGEALLCRNYRVSPEEVCRLMPLSFDTKPRHIGELMAHIVAEGRPPDLVAIATGVCLAIGQPDRPN